jgi:hypothetical protein
MRFFSFYKPALDNLPPTPEKIAAMTKLIDDMRREGVLLATEGFMPNKDDVRVRYEGGEHIVTDGPFTEAKEVIGGFALMACTSRAHAIAEAKRFLEVVGGGECEVHQLLDAPEMPLDKAI